MALAAQSKSNLVPASFLSHLLTVVGSAWNILGDNPGSFGWDWSSSYTPLLSPGGLNVILHFPSATQRQEPYKKILRQRAEAKSFFFFPLEGGISWCIWTTLPTYLNFSELYWTCTIYSRIMSNRLHYHISRSWSVSLWEILRCYRASNSIKLENYSQEFYTLAWNNSLSNLSLTESSIEKGKEVLQQWVHFICLKKENPCSLLRVNIIEEALVKQLRLL